MTSPSEKHYHILLSSPSGSKTDSRVNLDPGFWKTPVDIDDADLTFDGKPLNLLHEENQRGWMIEHHVFDDHTVKSRGRKMEDRRGEVSESFFTWSFPFVSEG